MIEEIDLLNDDHTESFADNQFGGARGALSLEEMADASKNSGNNFNGARGALDIGEMLSAAAQADNDTSFSGAQEALSAQEMAAKAAQATATTGFSGANDSYDLANAAPPPLPPGEYKNSQEPLDLAGAGSAAVALDKQPSASAAPAAAVESAVADAEPIDKPTATPRRPTGYKQLPLPQPLSVAQKITGWCSGLVMCAILAGAAYFALQIWQKPLPPTGVKTVRYEALEGRVYRLFGSKNIYLVSGRLNGLSPENWAKTPLKITLSWPAAPNGPITVETFPGLVYSPEQLVKIGGSGQFEKPLIKSDQAIFQAIIPIESFTGQAAEYLASSTGRGLEIALSAN